MSKASDIIAKATKKFEKAEQGWKSIFRKAREDLHFLSDEPYAQWDEQEANNRTTIGRPALTIDQLTQFVHQVTNDIRMNTPTINVIPDGNGADKETADVFKGLIKGIEYNSNADAAYDTAADFSVKSSIGFIRVDHGYCNDDSFEQELQIKRVINPASIFLDPESTQPDGSDAKFAFVLEELSKEEFKKKYPKATAISFGDYQREGEQDSDKITIAEYFFIEESESTKGLLDNGDTEDYAEGKQYKSTRKVSKKIVRRYKLAGQDVLAETTFPGVYIPVVPVYGEEAWIAGKRNLLSLIRKSKDVQRMFNLWASTETELLLKQQQAPVQAAVGQMRDFEDDWKTPDKAMVLYYHQTDANGDPAPAPQRLQPPTIPTGIVNAKRETVDDIKATMGLYNASIGNRSNETSGVAIERRQQEGDVATFHFADNLVRSITQVGRILVFAIPEIYDTERVIKIVGDEDEVKTVGINGKREEEQEESFDLSKGRYNVRVITGASFTTQRQEAAAAYSDLISKMPDLMPVIGDLVFKYQDTAGAQAISSRLRKLVDPKLLDEDEREEDAPDPEKEQMAAALQEMQTALQQMQAELESKQVENQVKVAEVQIKQEEVGIKKDDLKLKYLTALQQPQQKSVESEAPVALPDDSIEVLQARIQAKIMEQQALAEKAATEQQEQAMELQQEAQEAEMKMAQTNAVIEALNGIQQQVSTLTQATMLSAEQTAKVANNQDKPIEIIRDEAGNLVGIK